VLRHRDHAGLEGHATLGVSKTDLAGEVGVSTVAIGQYEAGVNSPRPNVLERVQPRESCDRRAQHVRVCDGLAGLSLRDGQPLSSLGSASRDGGEVLVVDDAIVVGEQVPGRPHPQQSLPDRHIKNLP
jgi:Helix-turn-helix